MKVRTILSIIAIAALVSSCLVNSLHPFYTDETIVYDTTIVGEYSDQHLGRWKIEKLYATFGKGANKKEVISKGFSVRHYTKDEWAKIENRTDFETPLFTVHDDFDVFFFKINNQLYADFSTNLMPTFKSFGEMHDLHNIKSHSLAKVIRDKDNIEFIWFNGLWLAELIENNRIKIPHEYIEYPEPYSHYQKGQYVLTASTKELQSFIKKYGNDKNAFVRTRKKLDDGFYTWNVGPDHYTGQMTFRNDSVSHNFKLKKLDDKE